MKVSSTIEQVVASEGIPRASADAVGVFFEGGGAGGEGFYTVAAQHVRLHRGNWLLFRSEPTGPLPSSWRQVLIFSQMTKLMDLLEDYLRHRWVGLARRSARSRARVHPRHEQ